MAFQKKAHKACPVDLDRHGRSRLAAAASVAAAAAAGAMMLSVSLTGAAWATTQAAGTSPVKAGPSPLKAGTRSGLPWASGAYLPADTQAGTPT
jgi:hypothetical protein